MIQPKFKLRDFPLRELESADEFWTKGKEVNTDPYGACVYDFAEDWAVAMEEAMEGGKKLEDCAEKLSYEVSEKHGGITGFMYGVAVSVLSACWYYGEQLRRWHNKDAQIGDEGDKANEDGGVLNPALLCISPK